MKILYLLTTWLLRLFGKRFTPVLPQEKSTPYKTGEFERLLAESDNLAVVHEWEYTYIVFKHTMVRIEVDWFYGNPQCSAIGRDEEWILIGGEHLTVWKSGANAGSADTCPNENWKLIDGDSKNGAVSVFEGVKWVHAMRVINRSTVDVLTDPYAPGCAIWRFDVAGYRLCKLRDFPDYVNKPYTEHVVW